MPKDSKAIFAFIENAIRSLEATGESEWASKLRAATQISFMPGELFREIRQVLREFQGTDIPSRLGMKDQLADVTKSLDEIIGDF